MIKIFIFDVGGVLPLITDGKKMLMDYGLDESRMP